MRAFNARRFPAERPEAAGDGLQPGGTNVSDIVRDVSPASLARANEVNLAEGLAACDRAYGGEVYDEPDLLWCAAGFPSAGFNRVPRADLAPETLDARIEWVIARARALR